MTRVVIGLGMSQYMSSEGEPLTKREKCNSLLRRGKCPVFNVLFNLLEVLALIVTPNQTTVLTSYIVLT